MHLSAIYLLLLPLSLQNWTWAEFREIVFSRLVLPFNPFSRVSLFHCKLIKCQFLTKNNILDVRLWRFILLEGSNCVCGPPLSSVDNRRSIYKSARFPLYKLNKRNLWVNQLIQWDLNKSHILLLLFLS